MTVIITCIVPMFRTAGVTADLVANLLRCELPKSHALNIVVVDDDSGDGSAETIEAIPSSRVRVVRNASNRGRSCTRNIGGYLAGPGYLLFLDSDCVPGDAGFVKHHLKAMDTGHDISVGSIAGTGEGFWHRYQQRVAERRSQIALREGAARAATSPNFMIRRDAFIRLGGFDESYRGYGFEDRDFFLRAQALGLRTAWTPSAVAIHADAIDLASLCRKMREAGGTPAARFAAAHPAVYASLGYAALDARRHPWLKWLSPLASAIARRLVALAGPRMDVTALPFAVCAAVVRLVVAASYLEGSVEEFNRTRRSKSA